MSYHRYSVEHYGDSFLAVFGIDWGYLAMNLSNQWQHLARLSWWPLYVIPIVVLLGLVVALVYAVVTKRESPRAQICDAFALDTVILAVGAYGIATVNFALAVLVDHVRLNGYDDRYLTLTNLFAPVSGLLTLSLLLTWAVRTSRAWAYLQPAFVVGAVVLLAIRMPVARYSPGVPTAPADGIDFGDAGAGGRADGRLLGHLRVRGSATTQRHDCGPVRGRFI